MKNQQEKPTIKICDLCKEQKEVTRTLCFPCYNLLKNEGFIAGRLKAKTEIRKDINKSWKNGIKFGYQKAIEEELKFINTLGLSHEKSCCDECEIGKIHKRIEYLKKELQEIKEEKDGN